MVLTISSFRHFVGLPSLVGLHFPLLILGFFDQLRKIRQTGRQTGRQTDRRRILVFIGKKFILLRLIVYKY